MNITLTTDHPASSHGKPVAVVDGQAYGPDDIFKDIPMRCYIIINLVGDRPDLDLMMSFLSQSPDAYKEGKETLARWYKAPKYEVF
jgi:hypothetical protein